MDDRNEEVFQQYGIKINNTYRARGAILLDTDKGFILYSRSDSSNQRLEYENSIKLHIQNAGYEQVDVYLANKENALVSADRTGATFTMRYWFQGEECNLRDITSAKKAADNLGRLHNVMKNYKKGQPHMSNLYEEEDTDYYLQAMGSSPRIYKTLLLPEIFGKRNRELKRVRSYMMDKKQKNQFEILFLQAFSQFYENGLEAERLLEQSPYHELLEETEKKGIVYHGSYNQHNVLFTKRGIATTNFDKADMGLQILDLYQFLRKAMEKNNWNLHYGTEILESYLEQTSLDERHLKLLYILMLFPEKFWKITNYYYNNKKSWISGKNMQKLSVLKEQESQKVLFLQRLEDYCKIE